MNDKCTASVEAEVVEAQAARLLGNIDPRKLYRDLLSEPSEAVRLRAKTYLQGCLDAASLISVDLDDHWHDLESWTAAAAERTGSAYRDYLASRRAGGPRRYFQSFSHALYFLRSVAPTKMVDGAWLFGTLEHWKDPRYFALIRTYLEELGEGVSAQNHVAIYRRLLKAHGCDQWESVSSDRYIQGAIQLALAALTDDFLPEIIGYNLGYEQPPLHLLITSYELRELGIDPYYFTLHVTVDNACSGHARRAIDAVQAATPITGDIEAFRRRVLSGYRLNELGAGAEAIIGSFDIEREVLRTLQRKSVFGKFAHSDYCQIAGRPISQWLEHPSKIPGFLEALQKTSWIKRNRSPEESPFWRLIDGEGAKMFGVFNRYELTLIHEWISGDFARRQPRRAPPFQARRLLQTTSESQVDESRRELEMKSALHSLRSREERMRFLLPFLSPAMHSVPEGLLATRLFNGILMGS